MHRRRRWRGGCAAADEMALHAIIVRVATVPTVDQV